MLNKCTQKLQDAVFKLDREIKPSENRAQSSNAFALSYNLNCSDFVEMLREICKFGRKLEPSYHPTEHPQTSQNHKITSEIVEN
jgi:hypothetical protein